MSGSVVTRTGAATETETFDGALNAYSVQIRFQATDLSTTTTTTTTTSETVSFFLHRTLSRTDTDMPVNANFFNSSIGDCP